jgi:hypothetical protein
MIGRLRGLESLEIGLALKVRPPAVDSQPVGQPLAALQPSPIGSYLFASIRVYESARRLSVGRVEPYAYPHRLVIR